MSKKLYACSLEITMCVMAEDQKAAIQAARKAWDLEQSNYEGDDFYVMEAAHDQWFEQDVLEGVPYNADQGDERTVRDILQDMRAERHISGTPSEQAEK